MSATARTFMEDNEGQVCLSNGTNHGKSGHFRRAVGYFEGLTNNGTLWYDKVPSNECIADILTKVSVGAESKFSYLRNVSTGKTPYMFISRRVCDIIANGHVR